MGLILQCLCELGKTLKSKLYQPVNINNKNAPKINKILFHKNKNMGRLYKMYKI
jgi:hypothetical protein